MQDLLECRRIVAGCLRGLLGHLLETNHLVSSPPGQRTERRDIRDTGYVITDYLAAQAAGRYLKQAIESGYDNGREMYTMTVEEVLEHCNAVVKEAGRTDNLPSLPVISEDIKPERYLGVLPGDPGSAAYFGAPDPNVNERVKL